MKESSIPNVKSLRLFILIASFFSVGPILIMLNAQLIHQFKCPIFISSSGIMMSTIVTQIMGGANQIQLSTEKMSYSCYVKNVLPIGLLNAIGFSCGNMAYLYLTISLIQIIKAWSPVLLLIMASSIGLEKMSVRLVISILLISFGTATSVMGELHFSSIGVLAMFMSALVDCAQNIYKQIIVQRLVFSPMEALYWTSPAMLGFLIVLFAVFELPHVTFINLEILVTRPQFLVSGILGFLVNLLSFMVVRETSALSLRVISQARNISVVLGSCLFFEETLTMNQIIGYIISLFGTAIYHRVRTRYIAEEAGTVEDKGVHAPDIMELENTPEEGCSKCLLMESDIESAKGPCLNWNRSRWSWRCLRREMWRC